MFLRNIWSSEADTDIGANIPNSLLLDSSLSQCLTKGSVSSIGTSPYKKTFSFSVKRGKLGVQQCIIGGWRDATSAWFIGFDPSDVINLYSLESNVVVCNKVTTALFRDTSAHYDIIVVIDVTLATAEDRVQLFINGVRITSFSTNVNPAQNSVFGAFPLGYTGQSYTLGIGVYPATGFYFDGYISRAVVVDGPATPDSLGRFSADTGQWVPKNYTGTYGTNGFKLDFTNSAALGTDSSGNGNNWTVNGGITSANQYTDTPTNNFAVLSPVDQTSTTLTRANIVAVIGATRSVTASFGAATKVYWETTYGSHTLSALMVGVVSPSFSAAQYAGFIGQSADSWAYFGAGGAKYNNNSQVAYGAGFTTGDVIGVAFDPQTGSIWFSKNGVWQGGGDPVAGTGFAYTGLPQNVRPAYGNGTGTGTQTITTNFGARPFTYTPPAGFKALCTANLPKPSIINPRNNFDVVTRNGFGAAGGAISSLKFKPDFLWSKGRNLISDHYLIDSVRGIANNLRANQTVAESSLPTFLTAFNADGYSLGAVDWTTDQTAVEWLWKAGGAAVANNAGSIASQVSANVQAGFSIVTYTGTGVNATVGHGLGKAPELIILKSRSRAGSNWVGWHTALSGTEYLLLNTTAAKGAQAVVWNSTIPTNTVFSVGTNVDTNSVNTFVAYCFAEIEGYSKIGSYAGSGSADGPFVYCGFKPRYIMFKRTDAVSGWVLLDTNRNPDNPQMMTLTANASDAEFAATAFMDFTATGFKLRMTNSTWNASGGTYIFLAIAEAPTKYATAR